MTIHSIALRGASTPQAIHVTKDTTNWDELLEFSWQEWGTPERRMGIYRICPLHDTDDAIDTLGTDTYDEFVADGAMAGVHSEGLWVPLNLGDWIVKDQHDELFVYSADEFAAKWTVVEP